MGVKWKLFIIFNKKTDGRALGSLMGLLISGIFYLMSGMGKIVFLKRFFFTFAEHSKS